MFPVIVSHTYKFIFMRTEKTGGSSLSEALKKVIGGNSLVPSMARPAWAKFSPIHHGALKRNIPDWFGFHPHATAKQARRVLGKKIFDNYFKFAVERNPWDRQISLYMHREWKKNNENPNFDNDMGSFFYRATEYCKLNNWSIYSIGETVAVDRVLRYENLNDELAVLHKDLKIESSIEMPTLRKYTDDRPHYSTYYSKKTQDLVAHWYRKEIDALGYEFETRT